MQWTIISKNAIKRTQYKNIQQLIVQCSQIPRLRRSLQSSIYVDDCNDQVRDCHPSIGHTYIHMVAWLSGSALVSINVVTPRWARLVLGWVTICGWISYISVCNPSTSVNSAFHPSMVGKSSTSLHWLGLRRGVFACVGWQVILCDPVW